jgi:hypothetical protein
MAIPSDPTVAQIVTEALKAGGRVSPSSTQITDATTHFLRQVKSDIAMTMGRADVLIAQRVSKVSIGVSRYAWPTDAMQIQAITLIDAPDTGYWNSTATAGAATTITLSASFDQSESDVLGRFIFLLAGTGSTAIDPFRQIIDYNNTTKVATVDASWTTNPASGTEYLIETGRYKLWEIDKPVEFNGLPAPWGSGRPFSASMVGREYWMDYAASRVMALWWDQWCHLDRIDEGGTMFIRHMRDYRSLWHQGMVVKTGQRFDEERYQLESSLYTNMLMAYGGGTADVGQVQYRDV